MKHIILGITFLTGIFASTANATEYELVYIVRDGRVIELRRVEIWEDVRIYNQNTGAPFVSRPQIPKPSPARVGRTNRVTQPAHAHANQLAVNFLQTGLDEEKKSPPDYVQAWTNCHTSILVSVQVQQSPITEALDCRERSKQYITNKELVQASSVSKQLVNTLLP